MLQINTNTTNQTINEELALLRTTNSGLALRIRKVYESIKCTEFTEEPMTGTELAKAYVGSVVEQDKALEACEIMLEWLTFEETEDTEFDIPSVSIPPEVDNRYAILNDKEYADMTAYELSLVLFKDLGTELEQETMALNIGLKDKLDMLDELKNQIRESFPDIRTEELSNKLANALAVTKQEKGSSLALSEGNLAVYKYLSTDKKVESKNMLFLADMNADKTQSLDILVLKSALKSYKAEVAKNNLPILPQELNRAIASIVSGKKPLTEQSKSLVKGMFK